MDPESARIGVYGGTFDPIHQGHIDLARHVLEHGDAGQILFVVSAQPPHKPPELTPFAHRMRMVEIALAREENMSGSDVEAKRPGPSYTADTLALLSRRYRGRELAFLLGLDSLLEIHLWQRFEEILNRAHLVAVHRPGIDRSRWEAAIRRLPGNYLPDEKGETWTSSRGATIRVLPDLDSSYSSSQIRSRLNREGTADGLVPEVLDYIRAHGLYGTTP